MTELSCGYVVMSGSLAPDVNWAFKPEPAGRRLHGSLGQVRDAALWIVPVNKHLYPCVSLCLAVSAASHATCLLSVPVSLMVLVALNMLLFYKLYALERAAHTLETWHSYSVADR